MTERCMSQLFARPGYVKFSEGGKGINGYDTRDCSDVESKIHADTELDDALCNEILVSAIEFPAGQSNIALEYRVLCNYLGELKYFGTYKHARSAKRKTNKLGNQYGWTTFSVEPVVRER